MNKLRKRILSITLTLTMLIGLVPMSSFTVFAEVESVDKSGKLGYGFNALKSEGIDFDNLSSGFGHNRIFEGIQFQTTDEGRTRSNYIYSYTKEDFTKAYTNSRTLSLNASIPIKVATIGLDAKFGQDFSRTYTSSKTNLLELYYSENITKKAEIVELDGLEGAKTHLTQSFSARLIAIKNESDQTKQKKLIDNLFADYGTHAVVSVYLGGTLQITNYKHSNTETHDETLKNNSSLSASIGVGKFSIKSEYSTNSSDESRLENVCDDETRTIAGYGATYSGTNALTDDDFEKWQNDLKTTSNIVSFVDNRSLIPVWELTDDESLSETIYSYYTVKMISSSDSKLDSFIYYNGKSASSNINGYSIVPFSELNLVAPGSTIYFPLPYDDVKISLQGDSVNRAVINNPSYGAIKFNTTAEDNQKVTVDFKIGSELIQSVVFTIKKEGYCDDDPETQYFYAGYGTKERPYLISTASQLQNLKFFCNEKYSIYYYKLIQNIDLSGGFEPLETFYGCFNGNGKSLANWTYQKTSSEIDSKTSIGFFCNNYGKVSDLDIINFSIKKEYQLSFSSTTPLIVDIGCLCGINYGDIKNVLIKNSSISGIIKRGDKCGGYDTVNAGGICGDIYSGNVTNCSSINTSIYSFVCNWRRGQIAVRGGGLIGCISDTNSTSKITNLFAYKCQLKCDAEATGTPTYYLGNVYIDEGGAIGIADGGQEVERIIGVDISFATSWSTHHVSSAFKDQRLTDICCGKGGKWKDNFSKLAFEDLSDATLDPTYKSYGWRQNQETKEFYFAKEKQETLGNTDFPFVKKISADSIELLDLPIFEYKRDTLSWKEYSNTNHAIYNVNPNSTHYIYVRYAETGSLSASEESNAIIVTTPKYSKSAPNIPLPETVTDNSIKLKTVSGCEYKINDDGVWQSSPEFTGLEPYRVYKFYQRLAETPTSYASPSSINTIGTLKRTIDAPPAPTAKEIKSSVITLNTVAGCIYSINGTHWTTNPMFGALSPNTEYIFYQRYAETNTTYESAVSEGKIITTAKLNQVSPYDLPRAINITSTSITLKLSQEYEYKIENGGWQKSNVFNGLSPATTYTFYQRYAENDTYYASEPSSSRITTEKAANGNRPPAPTVSEVADTYIILDAISGCEYSIDGVYWQSRRFDNLKPNTEYTFVQRYVATSTILASESSDAITVSTLKRKCPDLPNPMPIVQSLKATEVVLHSISGYEYSIDGIDWQSSSKFSNLLPRTEYTFYQRIAETSEYRASESSGGLSVTTPKQAAYIMPGESPKALSYKITATTVELINPSTEVEYEFGFRNYTGLVQWQSSTLFSGLSPATVYTFYQRIAETEELDASEASAPLLIRTAPEAPTIKEYTSDSVTLNPIDNGVYCVNGKVWQANPTFSGLKPNTIYTFYQKILSSDYLESDSSTGVTVTTKKMTLGAPKAPNISVKTENSITVEPVDGCEYKIGDGAWQVSNTFTGLFENTEYVIYQRYAETDTSYVSEMSLGTYVTTDKLLTDDDPQMIINKKTTNAGKTVTLSFELKNIQDIKSVALSRITYDGSALELISGEWKVANSILQNWNSTNQTAAIAFADNTNVNGVIFELTFKVKDETEDGIYPINCSITAKTKVASGAEENVVIPTIEGSVNVVSVIRGDVNGDNLVTSDDAIQVLYYTLLPDIYTVNQDVDFNGDGLVTSDDAIHLLYYTLLPDLYPLH